MRIVFSKRVTPKRRNEAECTEASISTIEAEGPRMKKYSVTQMKTSNQLIARFSFICKGFWVFLSFLKDALFLFVLRRFLEGVTQFATQICVTPFLC